MGATAEDRPRVSASRRGTHLSDGCNSRGPQCWVQQQRLQQPEHRLTIFGTRSVEVDVECLPQITLEQEPGSFYVGNLAVAAG